MRWLDGIIDSMDMSLREVWEIAKDREAWHAAVHGVMKSWTRLKLGKIEGGTRRGQQRMRWLDGIIDSMDMSLSRVQEMGKDRQAWSAAVHGVAKS